MLEERIERTILRLAKRAREVRDRKLIELTDELWELWINYKFNKRQLPQLEN